MRIWLEDIETTSQVSLNALSELVAKEVLGRSLANNEARSRPFTTIADGGTPRSMDRIVSFLATMPEFAQTAWLYHHPFWRLLGQELSALALSDAVEVELKRLGLHRLHVSDSMDLEVAVANRRFESMYDEALRKSMKWLESRTRVLLLAIMCGEAASVGAHEVIESLRRALDSSLQDTRFGRGLWLSRLDLYEEILDACQYPRFSHHGSTDDRSAIVYRARSLLTK